ncbi:MAG: hypothetical protein JRC55_06240 [Deltaproteobacteria bacterium]|nr:hypothetical protein [Deltaproteobacteria bacterium]
MALETKEQVLEKILSEKKPLCHHCGKEMSIWEVPPFSFSDGLGWGEPYLFVCFNNDCPVYLKGWDDITGACVTPVTNNLNTYRYSAP